MRTRKFLLYNNLRDLLLSKKMERFKQSTKILAVKKKLQLINLSYSKKYTKVAAL